MTDNYTSAEMLKLVVKDVHFSVGITDYNGWPTVTIKAPNGQEQWYVPSNDMNYMKKKDAKYERQDRELEELRRKFSFLMDDKNRVLRFALDWKEQLDESTKKLEQTKKILQEASDELVQIQIAVNRCRRESKGGKK